MQDREIETERRGRGEIVRVSRPRRTSQARLRKPERNCTLPMQRPEVDRRADAVKWLPPGVERKKKKVRFYLPLKFHRLVTLAPPPAPPFVRILVARRRTLFPPRNSANVCNLEFASCSVADRIVNRRGNATLFSPSIREGGRDRGCEVDGSKGGLGIRISEVQPYLDRIVQRARLIAETEREKGDFVVVFENIWKLC